MSEQYNLNDLMRALENKPKKRRRIKAEVKAIIRQGAWEAELELRRQEKAYHRVGYYGGTAKTTAMNDDGTPQYPTENKKNKKASTGKARVPVPPWATKVISYRLRDRRLYFYTKSVTQWVSSYHDGHITEGELREFVTHLVKMQ